MVACACSFPYVDMHGYVYKESALRRKSTPPSCCMLAFSAYIFVSVPG